MIIRAVGRRCITGAGVFYASFCDHLVAIVPTLEELDFVDGPTLEAAGARTASDDITIWFRPNILMAANAGVNICWAVFEATRLPREYIRMLTTADLIWTPSEWGRTILVANGVPAARIDVVPEGVDPVLYNASRRSLTSDAAKPFHFLAAGKFETRKSYRELLAALSAGLAGRADTRLALKADYFSKQRGNVPDLRSLVQEFPEIREQVRVLRGVYSADDMAAMYGAVDAFVFPSKAEGWGLTLIEAMAAGVPAVATNYSGHGHYLSGGADDFLPIAYTLGEIDDENYKRYWPGADRDLGEWALPSIDSMVDHMRDVRENHEAAQARAFSASERVRRDFCWARSAEAAVSRLSARSLL